MRQERKEVKLMPKEEQKDLYMEHMEKSHLYKTEGLEIKLETMRLLYQHLELLAEETQDLSGERYLRVVEVMAQLGRAILPD